MDRLIYTQPTGQAATVADKNGWAKNVRRELHQFIIKDIKIVIPDDGRPQTVVKSQNFYSRSSKHNRDCSQDGSQLTAEDFRRISSPDSGLESDNGRFAGSTSSPSKGHNDAIQDRIEKLRRLAFKAKYADAFTLSGTATPDSTRDNSRIMPLTSPLITNILPPLSPSEDERDANWEDRGTATVRSGALHFPSPVSNGDIWSGKTPSRVSFHEDSDFCSSDDSANQTGIFPFIDNNEEAPIHKNNAAIPREVNIVPTDDDYIYVFPSTASDSDVTESPSPKFPSENGNFYSPAKWPQNPQKISENVETHHDEVDGELHIAPVNSEHLYEVPDFSTSPSDENNLGSPVSEDNNGNKPHTYVEPKVSKNTTNDMDPDFCRVLDADYMMTESGNKDPHYLLIDHNSTPILRKKTEIKDSQNPSPSRKGSLRKTKVRVTTDASEKIFSDGSTQTRIIPHEDSCVQKGVPITSLSAQTCQTDKVKSAIASTQTTSEPKIQMTDKECQAEVTFEKQTQNMGVQVKPRTYTSIAQCQTPKTETTESSFQTQKITQTDKIIQVLPDKRAVYCLTDKIELTNSSTETNRLVYAALGTQTRKATFSEMAQQTDSKLPANVWNRLTQTAANKIQDAQSQIDSSFTGRPAGSQTVKLTTEAIECQTLEITSEQNSTQTEIDIATMSVQTEENFGSVKISNKDTKEKDIVSDEEVLTINAPGQLHAAARPGNQKLRELASDEESVTVKTSHQLHASARPKSLPVRNQVPRSSTPSGAITDTTLSPREVPRIEVASPDSSIHAPVGQKKNFMRSPVSTPGSLLSPRAGSEADDDDDKAGRLRRIALQAKIARSFAEGTPPASPRDPDQSSVLSTKNMPQKSLTPGSSTLSSPRGSKTTIKAGSVKPSSILSSPRDGSTARGPSKVGSRPPIQPKESPTGTSIGRGAIPPKSAGLKPILARPKNVTAERPLSASGDSKQRDVQVMSQKTGNRVRIKEFDIEQQNSKKPSSSAQPKVRSNTKSSEKQDSGGSTDSLMEELDSFIIQNKAP